MYNFQSDMWSREWEEKNTENVTKLTENNKGEKEIKEKEDK